MFDKCLVLLGARKYRTHIPEVTETLRLGRRPYSVAVAVGTVSSVGSKVRRRFRSRTELVSRLHDSAERQKWEKVHLSLVLVVPGFGYI